MSICQNATFQLRYQNESCSECRQDGKQSLCHYDGIYQKVQPLKSSTTYGLNFLITEKFNYGVEQFDYQKVQPIYFMTL